MDNEAQAPGLLRSPSPTAVQSGPIRPGTLLVQSWTVPGLLSSIDLKTRAFGFWEIILDLKAKEAERRLAAAGWHCCSMAPPIRVSALGPEHDALEVALRRVVAQVAGGAANAIEVTSIATRSFLGIDFVSLSALARHIERKPVSQPELCAARTMARGSADKDVHEVPPGT